MAFEERINSLNIDPFRTNEKLRAARYKGLAYLMRPIKENKWTRDNRVQRALKKIEVECNVSDEIKDTFELYFDRSKEKKLDLFDFYKVMEKCEVDVEASSETLFEQHFKSKLARTICKQFCRTKRTKESEKHVQTFD